MSARLRERPRDRPLLPAWPEEAANSTRLQRENRQIRGDDDTDCVKDRPLHFVRSLANLLEGSSCIVVSGEMPHDVLDRDDRTILTTMPKSKCAPPSDREIRCGIWLKIQTNGRERHGDANGMVSATMIAPRMLPRKRKKE